MKFEDFGVSCEQELEQDEFSLSRPTFGKDNQLTVIGWKGRNLSRKYYITKCAECSKDPELFGDGIFKSTKSDLIRGQTPCGCSKSYRKSSNQLMTLTKRKCSRLGTTLIGCDDIKLTMKSELNLKCLKHGEFTTNVFSFLTANKGSGCIGCKDDKTSSRSRRPDEEMIQSFFTSGKFKDGATFSRSDRKTSNNKKTYWNYTCPICSNDEYVHNGLCSGIFEASGYQLQKGYLSCRCSSEYRWTREQREYQIKKKMNELKTTDKFIGWSTEYKNCNSKFIRECTEHGKYNTSLIAFLYDNCCGCPQCAGYSQKYSYINLILDKNVPIGLKFGISRYPKQRVKIQNHRAIYDMEQIGVWEFPNVDSCKNAEKEVKKSLYCGIFTKAEIPDGWTETTSIKSIEQIIQIYKKYNGTYVSNINTSTQEE